MIRFRNKKTGKIVKFSGFSIHHDRAFLELEDENGNFKKEIASLAELNANWEDYEEPKEVGLDNIINLVEAYSNVDDVAYPKDILEKLKAWKRLKNNGFRFEGIKEDYTRILQTQSPFRTGKRYLQFNKSEDEEWMKENWKDLDLLFGGEE